MLNLSKEIVIFDTEYTSWEGANKRGWDGPNEYKEIVQIGAVILNTETFKEEDSLNVLVRPVKNPKLSEYFINLTGIEQKIVDQEGLSLQEAVEKFRKWSRGLKGYSFGSDWIVIKENCELIGIRFPFELEQFTNIIDVFENHGVSTKGYMSSTMPKAFGLEPPVGAHDALNDARSLAIALKALSERN